MIFKRLALVAALLCSHSVLAATPEEVIRAELDKAYPGLPITEITPAAIDGMYEVALGTGDMLYASKDGKHFVAGNLFEVSDKGFINLTEAKQNKARAQLMASVPKDAAIVFPAEGQRKARLFVFTDVDCGYCRMLHKEIGALNAKGIEVNYLAFPRTGINSPTYDKMVSVWCSDDPQQALTEAKTGAVPASKNCDNAVANDYRLGQRIGVTGTPTLVMEDGRVIPGYMPADELAKSMGL
ncbi:protein-disulfide isomerase [Pokkaliibacter plantistimulans]|uniref:Thiol:disulfide interchange protein n=1 Tax=Pokkaliibacter plantistimulans TaxID=1635171 RepID=A0ABX5LR73_9GAMM|nr:DsbC family protein [Pokkaliibacter plantistimulans]PXF29152.1 protein-disulfide isomerase [Pokkaliibacter plantistimulans]